MYRSLKADDWGADDWGALQDAALQQHYAPRRAEWVVLQDTQSACVTKNEKQNRVSLRACTLFCPS